MAAMTDLLNPAAAVTAGYSKIQVDRGAAFKGGAQYLTIFERWMTGEPGTHGFMLRAMGESSASAAAADTAATTTLNSQRNFRYGKGATQNVGALPGNAGNPHTTDVT